MLQQKLEKYEHSAEKNGEDLMTYCRMCGCNPWSDYQRIYSLCKQHQTAWVFEIND